MIDGKYIDGIFLEEFREFLSRRGIYCFHLGIPVGQRSKEQYVPLRDEEELATTEGGDNIYPK